MEKNDPFTHEQLEQIRQVLGWTHRDAARFFGVSRSTYIRREKRPSLLDQASVGAFKVLAIVTRVNNADTSVESIKAKSAWISYSRALQSIGVSDFLSQANSPNWRDHKFLHRSDLTLFLPESISSAEVSKLREALGWTQKELADFFGVVQSTVNGWETQEDTLRAPTEGTLRALKQEVSHRTWTLLHGEWLQYVDVLKELGVARFLVSRLRGLDWNWQDVSDQM